MTMWTLGLTIRRPLLRLLRPLRPCWLPRVLLFGFGGQSAWLPSVGGSFWTPSLPPLWCLGGGGFRLSFGCAAPLGRLGWAGVAVVFGGPLGGVLGGCCGRWPLCCSSSFGLGWSPSCSARRPALLGLLCRRCPLWVAAALLLASVGSRWPSGAKGRKVKYASVRVSGLGFGIRMGSNWVFSCGTKRTCPRGFAGAKSEIRLGLGLGSRFRLPA